MPRSRESPDSKPRLVDQHARVVLPKTVLEALRIAPGDHVMFVVDGDKVTIRKVSWKLE